MEAVGHGQHQSAFGAQSDAAKIFGRLPRLVQAGRGIVAVDQSAPDVDPPEHAFLRVPERSFAELGSGIDDAGDLAHLVSPPRCRVARAGPRICRKTTPQVSLAIETVTRMTRRRR